MVEVLKEAILGSIKSVYSIAKIVIPLMVVMQLAKDYKVLDKISTGLDFIVKPFRMSKEATFPLLVGLIFGLSYGAGVILQSAKEGNLSKKDTTLIGVFLIACHAVIEDTLIFAAIGANGWLLLGSRTAMAILVTLVISRTMKDHKNELSKNPL
ncbi:nucleoside recognition domain-containing protein [Geosporobacter ferrireducens]|uniref:Nucleoside recognition protein n=1 Tax=Geosporobacter ferrireducens TaxID=1424294 RepID=A0A1D8GDZ3_9FIRM|nr:nucleoside recognition domain-containing protein [Geosporobacter ferrireducens]AOT69128.1 nucleoside recognition protein [Geosporobacter ferrireducens]MTI56804.1 nucleoside recognition protein [Geosporobacter ferrireducens]